MEQERKDAINVLLHPVSITRNALNQLVYEIEIIKDYETKKDINIVTFSNRYINEIRNTLKGYVGDTYYSKGCKHFLITITPYLNIKIKRRTVNE